MVLQIDRHRDLRQHFLRVVAVDTQCERPVRRVECVRKAHLCQRPFCLSHAVAIFIIPLPRYADFLKQLAGLLVVDAQLQRSVRRLLCLAKPPIFHGLPGHCDARSVFNPLPVFSRFGLRTLN